MPALPGVLHNWKSAEPYLKSGAVPWLGDGVDAIRVSAYAFYDSVMMNAPDTWAVTMYEAGRRPVYIPTARTLINTINRFIAPGMEVIADPLRLPPNAEELVDEAGNPIDPAQPLRDLFDREMFYAKFASEKRMWRARGDMVFMVQGDLLKPEGSRLSLMAVDPAAYFPIWDETDPDVRVGCHIVEQWLTDDGDAAIHRTTFRKETPEGVIGGPGLITVESAIFELDKWGGPNMEESQIQTVMPPTPLDARITSIPVWHFRANYRNGEDYGTSDLAGLESLMVAMNQGASDEDIALALAGLGAYWSDAGEPVDDQGNPQGWQIGPARVVEVPKDHNFGRVPGINTVEPYQTHIEFLERVGHETMAVSDIARGRVSVDVAESGIALALELAPTLAMAEEQELEVTGRLRQMFYDLKSWLLVYEGINLGEYVFIPKYKDKVPPNRKQTFDELMMLFQQNVISAAYLRSKLREMGYDMPDDEEMMDQIVAEKTTMQQIVADVTGARIDQDVNDEPGSE